MKRIDIVGCGPGSLDYLSPAAWQAAHRAEILVGTEALLALFAGLPAERLVMKGAMSAVLDQIAGLPKRQVCVLVSGDPGLFSLARLLVRRFGRDRCRLVPAVSSVQLACARLALDWHDLLIVSAHGRTPQVTGQELARYDKIAVLAGDQQALCWAGDQLDRLGSEYLAASCENLSLSDEKIRTFADGTALRRALLPSRTVLLLVKKELLA